MLMNWHDYDSYWTSTKTYEDLKKHIQRNFDGLKDKVATMVAGR